MGVASATGVLTILAVAIIVVVATGFTPARSRLLDGGAWLSDTENMPHASGPNAAVDAAVQKCPDVSDCRWVQRDGLAYLLQSRSGQVHRLDTATRSFNEQGVSLGGPDSRLLVGTGRVYSIDRGQGAITSRDPVSLAPRGDAIKPSGGAGDAMVDRTGVLWVVESGTGNVLGIDDTAAKFVVKTGGAGGDLALGSIDDTPIVLDRGQGVLVPIDDRGREGNRLTLAGFDPKRVIVGRDLPAGPIYVIERGSGRLGRVDPVTGAVSTVGQMNVGDKVGALHIVGRNAFAVQPDIGVVRWYSLDDRVEHDPIGDASETFVKDGYLFANDARAREAHVAGPDSDPQPILKRRDDIPKFDVKPEQNTYNPTPISVTTTTRVEQGSPTSVPSSSSTSSSTSTSSTSSTTSTTSPTNSTSTLPATDVPPPAPTNVAAQGDDSKASVKWNSSLAGIDHFEIEPEASSASFNKQTVGAAGCGGGDCNVVINNLSNGSTYRFVIFAVDVKGNRSAPSPASNPVLVDAGLPGTAGTPTAKGRPNGAVEVSWSAAQAGAGGRPISGYTVTALDQGKQPLPNQAQTGGGTTTTTVSGLSDGQKYYFRVVAKNDAGKEGSPSDSQNLAGPFGRPTAVAVSGASDLSCGNAVDSPTSWPVTWGSYAFEADSAKKQYNVKLNGQPQPTPSGNSLTPTVPAGSKATIEVAAENDAGEGPSSSVTTTCFLQDAAGQLTFGPVDTSQTGSVGLTLKSTTATGATCCYQRISDPNIRITGPQPTGNPVTSIAVPTQYAPGEQAGPFTVPTGTLTAGTYDVIVQSPSGQLAVTSFDVTGPPGPIAAPAPGSAETTAVSIPDVLATHRDEHLDPVSNLRRNES